MIKFSDKAKFTYEEFDYQGEDFLAIMVLGRFRRHLEKFDVSPFYTTVNDLNYRLADPRLVTDDRLLMVMAGTLPPESGEEAEFLHLHQGNMVLIEYSVIAPMLSQSKMRALLFEAMQGASPRD